jgi:hypothetical protein
MTHCLLRALVNFGKNIFAKSEEVDESREVHDDALRLGMYQVVGVEVVHSHRAHKLGSGKGSDMVHYNMCGRWGNEKNVSSGKAGLA